MSSLLYEVSARDPITFVAVPVLLGGGALVATLLAGSAGGADCRVTRRMKRVL